MKRFFKIIIIILVCTAIFVFSFFLWLNLRLDDAIQKERYNEIVDKIQESQDLPPRFIEIYYRVTGYDKTSTALQMLLKSPSQMITQGNYKACPCMDANYTFIRNTIDRWTVALSLDKDVTPKKCAEYVVSRMDFLHQIIGIQEASKFYFNKEIKELTDNEMIEISLMSKNPAYYNKLRYGVRLQKKAAEFKNKINKQ